MKVTEIVKDWLTTNGYTGLFCEECGCEIEDLAPCDGYDSPISRCEAGYKEFCDADCPECDRSEWCDMDPEFSNWYITREKKEPTNEYHGMGFD